jgi:hypothetical protein
MYVTGLAMCRKTFHSLEGDLFVLEARKKVSLQGAEDFSDKKKTSEGGGKNVPVLTERFFILGIKFSDGKLNHNCLL